MELQTLSGKSQLIPFARFLAKTQIIQQLLFCHEMETTNSDSFDTVNSYFQDNNLYWNNCISICIDGATLMTELFKGFLALTQTHTHTSRREFLFNNNSMLFTL
jgi:hypothetical protein